MKNKIIQGILQLIGIMAVGAVVGYSIGKIAGDTLSRVDKPNIILFLITGVIAFILHIIVHEAGHLVFGLLSGYKFVSFRVFDFKIIKDENGKLSFRYEKIAGTGGQCLMRAPEYVKGKFKYKLYLLGGVIFNVLFSIVFWLILPSYYTLLFALIGFTLAFLNLIPMGFNDGMTFYHASKDETTRFVLYLQLEYVYYQSIGKNLLIERPEVVEKINSMEITKTNYLTDSLEFIKLDGLEYFFEFDALYNESRKLYIERDDLLPVYKIELMAMLVKLISLVNPEDELLEEIMKDKTLLARLKQKNPQTKNILATYEYGVKLDDEKALGLIAEARKIKNKAPNLYVQNLEMKYCDYLEEKILR
ncbi:site-2 protease family protein [Gemella sp.]